MGLNAVRTVVLLLLCWVYHSQTLAACGANTRTWQADSASSNWNTNNNWDPANRPNTANENAVIISDWFNPAWPNNSYTLGCLEIQSGTMSATNNRRVTIVGDYFRNLNSGSLIVGGANTWEVRMQGTADQTFENVDLIPRLRINNAYTVRLTESFSIRDRFLVDAGTGFVIIEGDLTTQQTTNFVLQAGVEITVASGASWTLNGSLSIDGTLRLEPGSRLIMADGTNLNIRTGGILDVNGAAGNAVTIDAEDSSSTFNFTVTGSLDAQYLVVDHMSSNGVNMNGTVTRFDNVTINSIPSSGSGMTLGAASSLPSGMDNVGFFDNGTAGPFTNVNASSYNVADVDFSNWSGIGDTANESDPNSRINWGTEATPVLQIQNVSGVGIPPATIAKGSASTQFATFAFSMSGTADTATDITDVTFTLDGSNINSDISNIAVFNDNNGNCSFDGGTDTLIGNYTPTGTPGTIDVSLSGEINVIDTTQDCLHVFMSTAAAATTDNTIGISIESTDDVTNDQDYTLSDTSGPPVNPGLATITGASVRRWNGGFSNNMFTAGNWTPNGAPNNTIDCEIGNGYQPPRMSAAFNCLNTNFQNSGTINWNNSSNIFNVYGAWTVENGFTYQNSNNAVVNIRGTGDQSISFDSTTFPNDVTINSGGTVTFEDDGVISGNLTINGGDFRIATGASLQIGGNITVASGSTFDIEPGGELILGNGSTLTINSGGMLEMVGTGASATSVRAVNDTSSYIITVNNGATISARYYELRNLGLNGLTINASATIDGTNFLQQGTFTYPGANNANLLRLFQEIPGDVLDGMSFDSNGSGATGVTSVFTSTGATADTLSMTNYSGDMTGAGFTNDNNYLVTWDSETNQLKLTQESTAPATSDQGAVVDMGTFGFQQLDAGAFNDTDITSIRITLIGTGSSSDVDSVSLYYDSSCSGSGGTVIGTKTFSGSPARAEFTSISGATVQADPTTPPLRCFNVEYNLDALAIDGITVGAEITSSTHVTNSEGYGFNASFSPAVNLGTTTIQGATTYWTGGSSTNWFTAGNWSNGVPNANLNCIINDQTRDPVISGGTAICKSMNIGNGTLTHNAGTLEIYGSIESTGTINSSAPVIIRDDGLTPTSQTIDVSSTIDEIQFNKTAGGSITIDSDVNVSNAMSINGAQDFTMYVTANNSLILNGGLTLSGAAIEMAGASELQIGAGQSLNINGGTFRTVGTNDAYPQSLANKAHITNTGGSSTWSFSASSGTVDLTGFYIDWLNTNGLNLSGTVTLANLDGGQLRNLPNSAGMRALQINTTGSIPSTASNFGWNWGPSNTVPTEASSYFLGHSTGCSSQTIDFDQWFGDFWPYTSASTSDKISASGCTILIDRAKSPVSLTHLAATAYDEKVIVEWETGNEWNHQGFNVYRSHSKNGSYTQINNELIRNDLFSTSVHGTYAFIDDGAENGTTYYYYLEDIALLGERTLHGPISATPDVSLGDPMTISAGTIVSSSDSSGGDGSSDQINENVEISENVFILAQTDSYMRLKINIPAMSLNADPLNASYNKISIDGFQPTTEEGLPELLSKSILLPISGNLVASQWQEVSRVVGSTQNTSVTPAPRYVPNGDQLQAQWFIDSTFYAINQTLPTTPLELQDVVKIDEHYYLPVVIHPVTYNTSTTGLTKLDQLIVDVYLEGVAPWQSIDTSIDPWSREAGIKLGLLEEGMYRVTYDELANAGVIAPVDGQSFSDIHLRISQTDIGYDYDSADGVFNSGDSIFFYAPSLKSDEDRLTSVLMYYDPNVTSLVAAPSDVSPKSGPISDDTGYWTKLKYEENNIAIFNEPYTEQTDHFVWALTYGISGGASSPLEVDIELNDVDSQGQVMIQTWVKTRFSSALNTLHNMELHINSNETAAAEKNFTAVDGRLITFTVPASQFVDGKNKISIGVTGDNLIAGEYDLLYVDYVRIFYSHEWTARNDQALILDRPTGEQYQLDGFSSANISFYDVSAPNNLVRLENFAVSDTSLGKKVSWELDSNLNGRRLWIGEQAQLKTVSRYRLTHESRLGESTNRADIVYMGHKDLLKQAKSLGDLRLSQGYEVIYADLESIYNEFSSGIANTQAVKDFVHQTLSWQKQPSYFVILGDGTYDPKAFQTSENIYRFPVKYISGSSFDFVSDHWFVANENGLPIATIGRIPAKTPQQLKDYVDKVINYENGQSLPSKDQSLTFVSDKPAYLGEDFETPISEIGKLSGFSNIENQKVYLKRTQLSDGDLQTEIINGFANSSLIHYMGHGAEDMWADNSMFSNVEALQLNNSKLPVVIAMNCLNALYSDPDFDSLAEALVMKKTGGAIAFWGSTSFSPPSIQSIYQKSFYDNLALSPSKKLGDLVHLSKNQAGLSSPFDEILYSWTIIGDPLVEIQVNQKTLDSNPSREPTSEATPTSGGGSGCSAFASDGLDRNQTHWNLIFGFLLEVLLFTVLLRSLVFRKP